ncbi:hypothetical protein NT6N_21790 [Oceaniferula spumae]|uniref:Uncharacterized protein n=1 Tax=Oceaniferula spumae TaxID=2979115 RepID=A0AAT9FMF4_9BACT
MPDDFLAIKSSSPTRHVEVFYTTTRYFRLKSKRCNLAQCTVNNRPDRAFCNFDKTPQS